MGRRLSKYQFRGARRKRRGGFSRLLAVLLLAGLAWLWWRAEMKPDRKPAAPASKPLPAPPKTKPATPPAVTNTWPRSAQTVLEAQIALERSGISCGSIDGRPGSQTRAAIRAFQRQAKLPETGELDAGTKTNLTFLPPALAQYTLTADDLARLQPLSKTWLGKSQQTDLDYETVLELVAEKTHAHPTFIQRLNARVDWTNVPVGTVLQVPDAGHRPAGPTLSKAAFVRISLSAKTLQAFDAHTNLLAHFPCSIARRVEKRPVGELHVSVIAPDPNYTFDPEIFPESPEARELKMKLILPPGPNNPVGTAWIGLDREGYGIHGTAKPEEVGRTESHGCFRLANWNAERLLRLAWTGMPVYVEP